MKTLRVVEKSQKEAEKKAGVEIEPKRLNVKRKGNVRFYMIFR